MTSVGAWTRGRISRTSSFAIRAIRFCTVPGEDERRSQRPHQARNSGLELVSTGDAWAPFSPVPQRASIGCTKSRSRVSSSAQAQS